MLYSATWTTRKKPSEISSSCRNETAIQSDGPSHSLGSFTASKQAQRSKSITEKKLARASTAGVLRPSRHRSQTSIFSSRALLTQNRQRHRMANGRGDIPRPSSPPCVDGSTRETSSIEGVFCYAPPLAIIRINGYDRAMTTKEAQQSMLALKKLRTLLSQGRISYEAAQEFAAPHLKTWNTYAKAKARKAGLSCPTLSFFSFFR